MTSLVVRNARLLDGRLVDLLADDERWTRIGEAFAADGDDELDVDGPLVTSWPRRSSSRRHGR